MSEAYEICSVCFNSAIRKGEGGLAFCEKHDEIDFNRMKMTINNEKYTQYWNGFNFFKAINESNDK